MMSRVPSPLPDWPTFTDRIGWNADVAALASRIAHCDTPQVFAIHGDWGAGKSSFARQVQFNLGAEADSTCHGYDVCAPLNWDSTIKYKKKVITVWFEAWRYQHESVPVVALLHEMRRQFEISSQAVQQAKKLGEVTFRVMLNTLSDVGKRIGMEALPSGEKITAAGEQWEKEHYAQRVSTDTISMLLKGAIETLLPKDSNKSSEIKARVVVFIDDLDRCNPDTAFKLLEGIKVYLNIPKCVFIFAMNETAMQESIAKNLPALDKSEEGPALRLRAAHYLEKLCTNIYRLPEPANVRELFLSYLPDAAQKEAVAAALSTTGPQNPHLRPLPPNPRRLKALANQWRRMAAVHWKDQSTLDERSDQAALLLVTAYIYQFHTEVWQRWRFDPDFWTEIQRWVQGEVAKESWLKCFKPLALPPEAARDDQSTRDYVDPAETNIFWIAALIREKRSLFTPRNFQTYLQST
jgi:hypothetical protein